MTRERLAWPAVLEVPSGLGEDGAADAWFARIAQRLLGAVRLHVGGASGVTGRGGVHRLVEIEVYFHGEAHPDPFVHAHTQQLTRGRWYFHRAGASYRGGSFKGVDLTFGDGTAYGGILVRSIEKPDGALVVGPSLCVDHLLAATGSASVAELDRAIGERAASDPDSPLHLSDDEPSASERALYRSARVGLTLKRHSDALAIDRLARRYRFLTEPRRVTKGRRELVAALLADGRTVDEIHRLTGSPRGSIR